MNTIAHDIVITKRNRPFMLSFTEIDFLQWGDKIHSLICVTDKKEQGRMYTCVYSTTGELISCESYN